jgi:twitching motility protein PilT
LTFGTLHTNSALQTINRIIDVFPPHQQSQVRAQLSFVLEGVVCQALLPKKGGGRVLSIEVMIPTPAIRNLIREDKIHQIYSQMQVGQGEHGMQTFNQSLAELVLTDQLEREEALARSSQPAELASMLQAGKGLSHIQRKDKGY